MFYKLLLTQKSSQREITLFHTSVRTMKSNTPRLTLPLLKKHLDMNMILLLSQLIQKETILYQTSAKTLRLSTPRPTSLWLRRLLVMNMTLLIHQLIPKETILFHTSAKMRTLNSPRATLLKLRQLMELGMWQEMVMVLGFSQVLIPINTATSRVRTTGHLTSFLLSYRLILTLSLTQSAPQPVALNTSIRKRSLVIRSTMEYQTSEETQTSSITLPPSVQPKA